MFPKSMDIMHLLTELQEEFLKNYLRPPDGETGLIIDC